MGWSESESEEINGPRRMGQAVVTVNGTIYSIGGESNQDNYAWDGPIDVFTLNSSMEWRRISAPKVDKNKIDKLTPSQRIGHTAVAHEGVILVWGGRDCRSWRLSNTLHRFDTNTHKWDIPKVKGKIPSARSYLCAVVIRNKMYVFGGCGSEGNGLHVLNLKTLSWSSLCTRGSPSKSLYGHSAAVYKDRYILIFGGVENGKISNSLLCFDVKRKEWSYPVINGKPPPSRYRHSAFMRNGILFIFGGYENGSYLNDLFYFDPETLWWKEVTLSGQRPSPRLNSGCGVLDGEVFIFGGYDDTYLGDTFSLEIC